MITGGGGGVAESQPIPVASTALTVQVFRTVHKTKLEDKVKVHKNKNG